MVPGKKTAHGGSCGAFFFPCCVMAAILMVPSPSPDKLLPLFGYGSIPIHTIFRGLFTSINPSYFDVNKKGDSMGFDPSPFVFWAAQDHSH